MTIFFNIIFFIHRIDRRSTDLSRGHRNVDYRNSSINEPLDDRRSNAAVYENADQEGRSLQMVSEFKAAHLRALQEKAKSLEEKERFVQGSSQDFQSLENNPVLNTLSHVPNPGVILDQLNQAIVQALHEQIGGGGALAPGPPMVEKPFGGNKTGNQFHENFRGNAHESGARQPKDMCNQFYMRGYCKRGASCLMKHVEGPEVLKGPSDLCFSFKATGKCDNPNCKYVHEELKITKVGGNKKTTEGKVVGICSRFRDFGNCKFGKNCRFSHDLEKVDICTWFRDYGRCKFGNDCAFSHKIDETDQKYDQDSAAKEINNTIKICSWFRDYGRCKFGKDCAFSHKIDETDQNINDQQDSPAKEINNTDKTTVMAKDEKEVKNVPPANEALKKVQQPKAEMAKNPAAKSILFADVPSDNENNVKATNIQNKEDDEMQILDDSIDEWRSSPNIVDLRQKIIQKENEKKQQQNDLSLPNKPLESAVVAKPNQPTQKPAVKKPVFDVSCCSFFYCRHYLLFMMKNIFEIT